MNKYSTFLLLSGQKSSKHPCTLKSSKHIYVTSRAKPHWFMGSSIATGIFKAPMYIEIFKAHIRVFPCEASLAQGQSVCLVNRRSLVRFQHEASVLLADFKEWIIFPMNKYSTFHLLSGQKSSKHICTVKSSKHIYVSSRAKPHWLRGRASV